MKKLFALVLTSAIITLTACAQKIDASKVPVKVKESFAKQFPGTTPKWEKEGDKYEAGFKEKGHEMSVLFEANGTMTESEMEIKVSELPASVLEFVKTNHKGSGIKEASKITKANGEVNYEAEVKGKDLIFDAAGKFLKEQKD
jgi:uncharacterized protein YxeA